MSKKKEDNTSILEKFDLDFELYLSLDKNKSLEENTIETFNNLKSKLKNAEENKEEIMAIIQIILSSEQLIRVMSQYFSLKIDLPFEEDLLPKALQEHTKLKKIAINKLNNYLGE